MDATAAHDLALKSVVQGIKQNIQQNASVGLFEFRMEEISRFPKEELAEEFRYLGFGVKIEEDKDIMVVRWLIRPDEGESEFKKRKRFDKKMEKLFPK